MTHVQREATAKTCRLVLVTAPVELWGVFKVAMMVSEQDTESLLPRHEEDDSSDGDNTGGRREGEPPYRNQQCRVSVEPAVLVTVFGLGLDLVFHDKLWLQKICEVHFGFGEKVCSTLEDGSHPEEEEAVQQLATRYRMYAKVVEQGLGLVMVVVMSVYSDVLDRRLPLLWCHAGFLLMALISAVNVYWWWLPPEMLLLNYVMLGAGGGTLVLYMGVEAYVSAVSEERHRTTRLAVLKVMALVGRILGPAVAMLLFHSGGYLAVFGTQSLAFIASIVYVLLMLERRPGEGPSIATQQQQAVMSLANLKSTVLVVCHARGQNSSRRILAHMCIVWMGLFSLGSLSFLFFCVQNRFHWSYKTFTLWSVIDVIVSLLGLLVAVPAISYICRARDGVLGLLGSFSLLFKNVLLATAPRAWVLYLGSAAGVCGEVVGVASRGAISKLVEKRHLGAVFGMLAVGEGLVPVLSAIVFASLYATTYAVFPGTVFVLSAFCCVLMSCTFVWEVTLCSVNSAGSEGRVEEDSPVEAPCPHLAPPGSAGEGVTL